MATAVIARRGERRQEPPSQTIDLEAIQGENARVVLVTNRSEGSISYTLKNIGNRAEVSRDIVSLQTYTATIEELDTLLHQGGGKFLLKEYLIVQDEDWIRTKVDANVGPEYFWDAAKIQEVCLGRDIELFLDALEFGPIGLKELMQACCLSNYLKITDVRKKHGLLEICGYNLDVIYKNRQIADNEQAAIKATSTRPKGVRRVAIE